MLKLAIGNVNNKCCIMHHKHSYCLNRVEVGFSQQGAHFIKFT